MEMKSTELGKSYWNNNGAYTTEIDKLWETLVPNKGEAETLHGELIRAFGRLNYDYGNNGNCNVREIEQDRCTTCDGDGYEDAHCFECDGSGEIEGDDEDDTETCYECGGSGEIQEDCSSCDGDGYEDGDVIIRDDFNQMIKFIEHTFETYNQPTDSIEDLREFLLRNDIGYSSYTFSDDEMSIYNKVGDVVGFIVTTTKNESRTKSALYKV